MTLARPSNLRELRLYAAGQMRGMSHYAMSLARSAKGVTRKAYVKAAREFHHTYLQRLREAQDATLGRPVGYYVPADVNEPLAAVGAVAEMPVRLFARQAS